MNNKYMSAGIMSLVAALLFVIAFVMQGISDIYFNADIKEMIIGMGATNFVFLLFALVAIIVMIHFKKILFEQFSFTKLNLIININIFWYLFFFGGSFLMELLFIQSNNMTGLDVSLPVFLFWIIGISIFGAIDMLIAIILLLNRKHFKSSIKVLAVVSLFMGFCEILVILAFFNLILVPIYFIALAFVFFQKVHEVEMV